MNPDFPWLSARVPDGFWTYRDHRLGYLAWLGAIRGFGTTEDWYAVRKVDFQRNHGGGLLHNVYNDSVVAAMRDFRPDFDWLPWKFHSVPQRYWQDPHNRRAYMLWLGQTLGYLVPEDWYRITKKSFQTHCGAGLLNNHYDDSPQRAVFEFLSDYEWKPWLFQSVPQQFWQRSVNRIAYLTWLGQNLGFVSPTDWYRLTSVYLRQHCGGGLLDYYEGLAIARELSQLVNVTRMQGRLWPLIQFIEFSAGDRNPDDLFFVGRYPVED